MTLVVACYTPTGIAISCDSRTTGMREETRQIVNAAPVKVALPWVVSDSTRKLFLVADRFCVATWGDAHLNGLPTAHHVNEFTLGLAAAAVVSTEDLADKLLAHFVALAPGAQLGFAVAGYDGIEPHLYEIDIAKKSKTRRNWDATRNEVTYGAFYAGDWDIVGRLVGNNAPIAWQFMNLQDAVDVTRHLLRTTIDQMKFEARVPTVGGPIETITSTATRARFLVRKELHA
jgi:hypothetical protein